VAKPAIGKSGDVTANAGTAVVVTAIAANVATARIDLENKLVIKHPFFH
jgi:hypothetical protein